MRGPSIAQRSRFAVSALCPVIALALFLGMGAVCVHGAEVGGTYAHNLLNKIDFQPDGRFSEQYVTDQYKPDFAISDRNGRKAPPIERETVCSASGFFTVVSSGILLDYQEDLCGLKKGKKVIRHNPLANAVIIRGKVYKKAASAPGRSGRQSGFAPDTMESLALEPAAVDTEAGYKTWRWQIGRAMQDVNNNYGGIWYCPSGGPRLRSTYWTWNTTVGDGGWVPNATIAPAEAVEWFYRDMSSSEGCTECLMAARSTYYKGLLETIGSTAFNNWFRNNRTHVVISYRSYAPTPVAISRVTSSEADLTRGDHVYFRNWTDTASCPEIGAWQGENAVAQNSSGTRTFIGLGIPGRGGNPLTSGAVLTRLWNTFANTGCPQTRTGRLANYAITGNPLYFENFKSLVGTLQSGAVVANLTGARASMRHYKLVVPAGATSFEVTTSGGTGDCDLYVKRDQWATRTLYNVGSTSATNAERVTVTANAPGTWYVALRGYSAYSGVNVVATIK